MRRLGAAAVFLLLAGPVFALDLTGFWLGNDGGRYYLRQEGERVFWMGESADGGRTWTHVATGKVSGNRIILDWGDVPRGAARSSGLLVLRVEGDRLVRVEGTGGFAASEWRRSAAPAGGAPELVTRQIIRPVTTRETSAFRHRPRRDLEVQTREWDRTPSIMEESTTETTILTRPRRITLGGNAAGTTGWSIDNFLLLEVLDEAGTLMSAGLAGWAEPVLLRGERVEQLGPNAFNFGAKQVDVTALFPLNRPFRLRVTALDYGGRGWVTGVWLLVE